MPIKHGCIHTIAILLLPVISACESDRGGRTEPGPKDYFKIKVIDEATGRGVPLVELRTTSQILHVTDNNGIAAFFEPGLMDQTVFFHVKSHGYEYPKDGFGFQGKTIPVAPGGSAVLKVKRLNLAERLYRVTGGGLYRDSLLTGESAPLRQPLLNGLVLGQDSAVNAVYRGKIYWFWGDTNRPGYPLGNFNVPGAVSLLPQDGGLDPEAGIDLTYFLDGQGFARPMAPMPGPGPTWIDGLIAFFDEAGRERLFAAYVKVRGFLEVYQHGLAEFNSEKEQFEKAAQFEEGAPVYPGGHPFLHQAGEIRYVYFANPIPLARVPAAPGDLKDLSRYEAFTCLLEGSRLDQPRLDRDEAGLLRYRWRRHAPFLRQQDQKQLVEKGLMKPEEALLAPRDAATGKTVLLHNGSTYWNGFRKRWALIFVESMGTSFLGEVWYAEADAPVGPWVYARKIVTHDTYSFYNPKQHPMLAKDGGRTIFFEGTYATTFSGSQSPTPRYDYNQVMYKLDLSDPRLALPAPVYRAPGRERPDRFGAAKDFKTVPPPAAIAFFAPDRPGLGTAPVYAVEASGGKNALAVGPQPGLPAGAAPLFHALPADAKEPPAAAAPLHEFVNSESGERAYSTDGAWSAPGFKKAEKPLCLVWRNPLGAIALEN
ncbi:MAG: hypothetical protein HY717_21770 [Planctomycetes bacterium]|nr:hypothetical protein [Planctomycetota bacterium]